MNEHTEFGTFFLPGPTEIRPEVLAAMQRPMVGHRGAEISELIARLETGLSALFRTERPVYLSTSSASGMMEAAVTNLSRRRVLCLVCGAFSQRFYEIARACGRPADRMDVEWGLPNLPDAVAGKLSERPGRYDLVTVVHSETSTGVLNPVAEIARAVHAFDDVLLAVDTVSSMAGAPVLTDEWGLDFVLTGTQKAVAVPPGLALAVASERALSRAAEVEARGWYFDLLGFERRMESWQTPTTPAVSLIYALARQVERIREEGLENRWERHRAMAGRAHAWVAALAERTGRRFTVLAPEGYRSPTVTVVELPEGVDGRAIVDGVRQSGFTIAPGYGRLAERSVRIGHMGDHTPQELEAVLGALSTALAG
ncbi:MAG: pyridoxal-phosphate-dependent aminotransferase family protein [Gemmatimonadota bacterium]